MVAVFKEKNTWTGGAGTIRGFLLSVYRQEELPMAHKKIERKKELDRRRKRRQERMKDRVREAKAAKKA